MPWTRCGPGVRPDEALERIDESRSVQLHPELVKACKLGIVLALRSGLQKTTPKRKRHLVHDPKVGLLHTRRRSSTKNMRFKPRPNCGACVRAHIGIESATWSIWVSRHDKDHFLSHIRVSLLTRFARLGDPQCGKAPTCPPRVRRRDGCVRLGARGR